MFTGIVETTARVRSVEKKGRNIRLSIVPSRRIAAPKVGQSVAVNGACLTLASVKGRALEFDVMPETLRCTSLGDAAPGTEVNIERALKYGDRLDGHYVLGHVEAVGRVVRVDNDKRGCGFTIEFPRSLAPRIVRKGCIAIEGISLTVADVRGNRFTFYAIPHTLAITNLKDKAAGSSVNLETDILMQKGRRLRIPKK